MLNACTTHHLLNVYFILFISADFTLTDAFLLFIQIRSFVLSINIS